MMVSTLVQALLGGACGPGIDVWSLGCVLAEVALQRPLFPVATTAELKHQVILKGCIGFRLIP